MRLPAGLSQGRGWAVLIAFVALAEGLVFWFIQPVGLLDPAFDSWLYHLTGQAIAGLAGPDNAVAAGHVGDVLAIRGLYPILVGVVYWVTGGSPAALTLLQVVVLLPATAVLTFHTGRILFGTAVGAGAGLVVAALLPFLDWPYGLFAESLVAMMLAVLVLLLAVWAERGGTRWALAAGSAALVVGLVHPAYQFLAIGLVVLVGLVLAFGPARREWFIFAATVLLGVAALLGVRTVGGLPQAGQGGQGFGAGGGWAVYAGSQPATAWDKTSAAYAVLAGSDPNPEVRRAYVSEVLTAERAIDPALRPLLLDDGRLSDGDFYSVGLHYLMSNPFRLPEMAWVKTRRLMHDLSVRPLLPAGQGEPTSAAALRWAETFPAPGELLAVLGLAGLLMLAWARRRAMIAFAPLVIQVAANLLTLPEARYSFPLIPSMALLAAYALMRAARRIHEPAEGAVREAGARPGG